MAEKAQVLLRGRFRPGTVVALIQVEHEGVLRAGEGGRTVDRKRVDEEGVVRFTHNVEKDGRYFVVGQVDGSHLEVRARGRVVGDEAEVLGQPPIAPDRQLHPGGRLAGTPLPAHVPAEEPGEPRDQPYSSAPPSSRDNVSGHDAMGQPLYADAARAAGVAAAKAPREPVDAPEESKSSKPAAKAPAKKRAPRKRAASRKSTPSKEK